MKSPRLSLRFPRPIYRALALAALAALAVVGIPGCGEPPQSLVRVVIRGLSDTPAMRFRAQQVEVALYFHYPRDLMGNGTRVSSSGALWDADHDERRVVWWTPSEDPFTVLVAVPESHYTGLRLEARGLSQCGDHTIYLPVAQSTEASDHTTVPTSLETTVEVRVNVTGIEPDCR